MLSRALDIIYMTHRPELDTESVTGRPIETKIACLPGVREWMEHDPVELWINRAGRLVIKAWNEAGHNSTEVDVFDLLEWLELGNAIVASAAKDQLSALSAVEPGEYGGGSRTAPRSYRDGRRPS